MSKRSLMIGAICVAVAAGVATVAVHRAHGSQREALWRMSNHGHNVSVGTRAKRAFRINDAQLLAVRDGRAFYRLQTQEGRCYGVGAAAAVGEPGGEACPSGTPFPSPFRPILDFSVYQGSVGTARSDLDVVRVEGFAADGIATVGILNRAGQVALRVPVSDNVYVLSHVPPGLTGMVVGLDSDGKPLGHE